MATSGQGIYIVVSYPSTLQSMIMTRAQPPLESTVTYLLHEIRHANLNFNTGFVLLVKTVWLMQWRTNCLLEHIFTSA